MPCELYVFNVNSTEEAYSSVSKSEQNKCLSSYGKQLVSHILKKYGREGYQVFYTSDGKPYIKDENFHFNISHSGDYVVCAVSEYEIGCDVQKHGEINFSLSRKYFPFEYEKIKETAAENEKQKIYFDAWTKKESYLKAVGCGIKGLSEPQRKGYSFISADIDKGYSCCVCVKSSDKYISIIKLENL